MKFDLKNVIKKSDAKGLNKFAPSPKAEEKLSEMRSLLSMKDFAKAAKLADEIGYQKLKNASDLNLLARAYSGNREFAKAKEVLKRQYSKKVSTRVLTDLVECSLSLREHEEAIRYFEELCNLGISREDRLMLEYKIERKRGCSLGKLIQMLEELKEIDYHEEYAYELVKMYHKAGKVKECVRECNDMIGWFGSGKLVENAKVLREYYTNQDFAKKMNTSDPLEYIKAVSVNEQNNDRYNEQNEQYNEQNEQYNEQNDKYNDNNDKYNDNNDKYNEENVDEFIFNVANDYLKQALGEEQNIEPESEYVGEHDSFPVENSEADVANNFGTEDANNFDNASFEETQAETFDHFQSSNDSEEEFGQSRFTVFGRTAASEDKQFSLFSETPVSDATRSEKELYDEGYDHVAYIQPKTGSKFQRSLAMYDITLEEAFGTFVRMESVRKQIVRGLEVIFEDRNRCAYLSIAGEAKSGKTELGKRIAKLLFDLDKIKTDKVAIIDGEKLEKMDLSEKISKVRDMCLIVERAGKLSKSRISQLIKLSKTKEGPRAIVLEDSASEINSLMRYSDEFNSVFANRIHLPAYGEKELMGFAMEEIFRYNYEIDKPAAEKLKEKMRIVARKGNEIKLELVKETIAELIFNAEERNKPEILEMAKTGKFKIGNYMVIVADDVK